MSVLFPFFWTNAEKGAHFQADGPSAPANATSSDELRPGAQGLQSAGDQEAGGSPEQSRLDVP